MKNLNYSLLLLKFFRKSIRVFSFKKRQSPGTALSLVNKGLKLKRKVFFRASKIVGLLRFNIFCLRAINFNKIIEGRFCHSHYSDVYLYSQLFSFPIINVNKRLVFYKSKNFLRVNNLQFVIKKKLNLRKQKVFFYSVHIAAPKKKTKK